MPDGSIAQQAAQHVWHGLLVKYGEVWLQGASGQELGSQVEREPVARIPWTQKQLDDAYAIHLQVIRLDPKSRIIVQVFYKARQAGYLHELEPDKQADFHNELCREINARWRAYCASVQELPRTVRGYQVQAMREAAIRALVVAAVQQVNGRVQHPCG